MQKIGRENFLQYVAGRHSLHVNTNENGKMLGQLAESNRLIIESTCFEHKHMYKETWKMQRYRLIIQKDILIIKKHASSVIDVMSALGPNCDLDLYW